MVVASSATEQTQAFKGTALCVGSYPGKGAPLMKKLKELGYEVVVVTLDQHQDHPAWPQEVDRFYFIKDFKRLDLLMEGLSHQLESHRIRLVFPTDDYAVATAAHLRSFLGLERGLSLTYAMRMRDKLLMRQWARKGEVLSPDFIPFYDRQTVEQFLKEVPGPWMLKPRDQMGSVQIVRCESPQEVWENWQKLGPDRVRFLLERYVEGTVYHVDAVHFRSKNLLEAVHEYQQAPFEVWNEGGMFCSVRLQKGSALEKKILKAYRSLIDHFGLENGISHTEFIVSKEDGEIYFLEIAARVGGAHIDRLIEASEGFNPWEVWAEIEDALESDRSYRLPKGAKYYGAILLCLSRDESSSLERFQDPAVHWKFHEDYHAGLVVRSKKLAEVKKLQEEYFKIFRDEYVAIASPTEYPA